MGACGGEVGSSMDTRVPEMMVEDPASGIAVVGMRSQDPATVRVVREVSEETVAETSRTADISYTRRSKRRRRFAIDLSAFEWL